MDDLRALAKSLRLEAGNLPVGYIIAHDVMRDAADALDRLAAVEKQREELRRVVIQGVTANPGVLHHYKCLACGGRWSGKPDGPEKHADGCAAAARGGA